MDQSPLAPHSTRLTSAGEIVAVYRLASGGLLYVPLLHRWRPGARQGDAQILAFRRPARRKTGPDSRRAP
jgi:hypothetical protein